MNAQAAAPAPSGANALTEIEDLTKVRFPAGATLIHHDRARDSDALVRAKLRMTVEQWSSFQAALQLHVDAFSEDKRYLLGINDGWWNPAEVAMLPTAQIQLPDAKVLNLGVDRSDPQQLLVYLVWHAT